MEHKAVLLFDNKTPLTPGEVQTLPEIVQQTPNEHTKREFFEVVRGAAKSHLSCARVIDNFAVRYSRHKKRAEQISLELIKAVHGNIATSTSRNWLALAGY